MRARSCNNKSIDKQHTVRVDTRHAVGTIWDTARETQCGRHHGEYQQCSANSDPAATCADQRSAATRNNASSTSASQRPQWTSRLRSILSMDPNREGLPTCRLWAQQQEPCLLIPLTPVVYSVWHERCSSRVVKLPLVVMLPEFFIGRGQCLVQSARCSSKQQQRCRC